MIIGVFSEKEDGRFVGTIQTLLFRADKVVFEPLQRNNPKGPAYRIYTGADLEIGAAWTQASKTTGEVTLSVLIDDPTLAKPIRCGLTKGKEGRWLLVWNRTTSSDKGALASAA